MVLQEVLILLESLRTGHPVLDLLVEFLFLILDLLTLLIKAINLLVQLVNSLILKCVVAVLGVQLLDQSLQLLLLRLHIDGVAFQIVMFLLLELVIKLGVQLLNDFIELLLGLRNERVLVRKLFNVLLSKFQTVTVKDTNLASFHKSNA